MNKIYLLPKATDAYGFLKQLAAEKYNIDPCSLSLARERHGKPYFEGFADFHFNISHSEDLQVIAVSERNVGIDIEKLRTPDLRVAKRFSKDEQAYITEADSPTRFFEVWTKKEAFLKHSGLGLAGGLDTFSVFKTEAPLKSFTLGEYTISVCGEGEFEIIDFTPNN